MVKPQFWFAGLVLLSSLLGSASFLGNTAKAQAQEACELKLGINETGQTIELDMCSLRKVSNDSVDFIYAVNDDRIYSQANCRLGIWTTYPDRINHRAQGTATKQMLEAICRRGLGGPERGRLAKVVGDGIIFVRRSPGGSILCSVRKDAEILVSETLVSSNRTWYYTDYCGQVGMIPEANVDIYYIYRRGER